MTGRALEPIGVPAYLIERSLLDLDSVLSGGLTLVDRSSRNRNYHVLSRRGPCFFLKQALTSPARDTLSREASFYRLLRSEPSLRSLRSHAPSLSHHDPERGILVLTSSRRAVTLAQLRGEGRRLPAALAAAFGRALGALHRATRDRHFPEQDFSLPRAPAWVLSACVPELRSVRDMSAAGLELTSIAQRDADLVQHLAQLGSEWRHECMIHGDIKAPNVLVTDGVGRRTSALQIVDWELAAFGDPGWDTGSVLADVLTSWLATAPISPTTAPDRIPSLTQYPLEREFPLIRAFWRSYARASGMDRHASTDSLLRSVRFAGARLVQTALEHSQTSARPSGYAICLLQLSRNMLMQPHQAAALLFGLKLGRTAPGRPGRGTAGPALGGA